VNKDLYDNTVKFPDEMKQHMKTSFAQARGANENVEGFKRNQELQGQDTVNYQQLKRIKNFFDNYKGKPNEHPFILNGGHKMKVWVDNQLSQMRNSISTTKKNKMNVGMENQFNDTHEKTFGNVRKSQEHKSTTQKYNSAVTESLKRINELMLK
jgi:hypothetical protein